MAVKGLGVALRNERALHLIGNSLGMVVRHDQLALKQREVGQCIRVVHDTRRRIRMR